MARVRTGVRIAIVDWAVAAAFAAGAIPGVLGGCRLAQRAQSAGLRTAFGWLLVVFSTYFTIRHLTAL